MSVLKAHRVRACAWDISRSQSLALRRARIVHGLLRSTTHLFGSAAKPFASLGAGDGLGRDADSVLGPGAQLLASMAVVRPDQDDFGCPA